MQTNNDIGSGRCGSRQCSCRPPRANLGQSADGNGRSCAPCQQL